MANHLVPLVRSFYCMAGNNALHAYEAGEKMIFDIMNRLTAPRVSFFVHELIPILRAGS